MVSQLPLVLENKNSRLVQVFVNFIDRLFKPVADSQRNAKTLALILYIAEKLKSKDNYGEVMLYKALYFIDMVNWFYRDSPISTLTYVKRGYGPAPDAGLWVSVKQELLRSKLFEANQLVGTRNADLSQFTIEEIELVNDITLNIDDWSAYKMPGFYHENIALIIADDNEPLPFFTFLLSAGTPSREDIEWAKAELKLVQGY